MRFTLRIALVSMLASSLFWGASQTSLVAEATDYYLELLLWYNSANDIVKNAQMLALERQREDSSRGIQREHLSRENRDALPEVIARYLALSQQHVLDDNMVRRVMERVVSDRRQKDFVLVHMLQVSERRNTQFYNILDTINSGDGIAPGDLDNLYFRGSTLLEVSRLYQYMYDLLD